MTREPSGSEADSPLDGTLRDAQEGIYVRVGRTSREELSSADRWDRVADGLIQSPTA
jgi:hypothetical protein